MKRQRALVRASLTALVALAASAMAQDRSDSEAALKAVQTEIRAIEARVARETDAREDGAKALRAAERETAAASRKLSAVRADLRAAETEQRRLAVQTGRALERLAAERAELASQVRASYVTGEEQALRLLLSQQDPAALGRMLVYFDYYNRARTARIAGVVTELREFRDLAVASERVASELAALEREQTAEVARLEESRGARRRAIDKIDAELRDSAATVAKLKAEEARLGKLVQELAELATDFPVTSDEPFVRAKGKLTWPVQGRVAGDYGQPRAGSAVRWSGVLLEAPAGTPVRAVHRGRISFSDWLPGLGLLVVIDHGAGYLSLYGHNEVLLKESGDWVDPGDTIAQVGETGGQARPGLYFEIRENGEPVDPHLWIARR